MADFCLRTLGRFELRYNGTECLPLPTKKARALLAYLVLNRSVDVSRDRLIEIFWPDFEPQRARENLKVTLWSIRRMLRNAGLQPDEVIAGDKSVIRWVAEVDCDAEHVIAAAHADEPYDVGACSFDQGDFLEGDFDDWVISQRERVSSAYDRLLNKLAGSDDVDAAQRLIGRNPYDETAYATLIEAEIKASRLASAAVLVRRYRAALDEFNASPSVEFEERFAHLALFPTHTELRFPFVGREPELEAIQRGFEDALRGVGSIILVGGDAGIGKTALVRQAIPLAMRSGLRTIEIHCTPDEPWMAGDWNVVFESLTGQEFSGLVKGAGFDVAAQAALAVSRALNSPAVVLIEDFHNLSGDSLGICEAIVDTVCRHHCVIVTSRPEGLNRARNLGHDIPLHELLPGCLPEDVVKAALHHATGVELQPLTRALYERTGGHPLYLTRLLEALVLDGAIRRGDSGWTLTREFDASLPLPETLTSFIEGRLNERGKTPAIVAGALALEPMATADELIAVLHLDESQLLDALDDLLSLGLIRQPMHGPQFQFSHDLIAEVALSILNAGRRVRIHRAFAQNLQSGDVRASPARLARHLLAAGNILEAGSAFASAADRALRRGGARDCCHFCEEGTLPLYDLEPSAERDRILSRLCELNAKAQMAIGELSQAQDAASQAVSFARTSNDTNQLRRSVSERGLLNAWMGNTEQAVSDAHEYVEIASKQQEASVHVDALVQLSAAARIHGNRELAIRSGREAFDSSINHECPDLVPAAAAELILALCTWWRFQEGQNVLFQAAGNIQRANAISVIRYHHAACALWHCMDRNADARRAWSEADKLIAQSTQLVGATNADVFVPVRFFHAYMQGVLAAALSEWEETLASARTLQSILSESAPQIQSNSILALMLLALLSRDKTGDLGNAAALRNHPANCWSPQQVIGYSACTELLEAQIAAHTRVGCDRIIFRDALEAIEQHAHETPLLADQAFGDLSKAAAAVENAPIEHRARERSLYFRSKRLHLAGVT